MGPARRRNGDAGRLALLLTLSACSLAAPGDAALTGAPPLPPAVSSDACSLGTKRCEGACVSVDAPSTGCAAGTCSPCAFDHAEPLCIAAACAMGPCQSGFADCDRDPTNGCEIDLGHDSGRCGSCLNACTFASPLCEDGVCVPRCGAVKLVTGAARAATKQGLAFDGDFTVELWLRWHGEFLAGAAGAVLTTNEALPMNGLLLGCTDDASGLGCIFRVVGGPSAEGSVIVPLTRGVWHHLAFQRAGGTLVGFVDGVPGATAPSTTKVTATSGVALGGTSQTPPRDAAPVSVGPVRFSTVARYAGPFTPRRHLAADAATAIAWLSSGAFDGSVLDDESGHARDATAGGPGQIIIDPSSPCAP